MARDITQLHPRLQEKAAELIALCEENGISIKIGECYRTVEEQNALYAQGRTEPGNKVTNAKGTSYSSQHQWGIAMDFFLDMDIDGDGKKSDDAFNNKKKTFNKVGKLAKSIGLGWGGDWKSPVDMPHVYLDDWGSTTSKLKSKYGTPEKFMKTWESEKKDETPEVSNSKEKQTVKVPSYKVGKVYTLQVELKVRTGAGTNYKAKKYSQLTANGKKKDKDKDGALEKGTKVTCKEIKKVGNDIWMKIPSGYVAAVYNGKIYIK